MWRYEYIYDKSRLGLCSESVNISPGTERSVWNPLEEDREWVPLSLSVPVPPRERSRAWPKSLDLKGWVYRTLPKVPGTHRVQDDFHLPRWIHPWILPPQPLPHQSRTCAHTQVCVRVFREVYTLPGTPTFFFPLDKSTPVTDQEGKVTFQDHTLNLFELLKFKTGPEGPVNDSILLSYIK